MQGGEAEPLMERVVARTGAAHGSGRHAHNVGTTMKVLDRTQSQMPQPWRTIVDWLVTLGVAVAFVLAFEAEVAKPYRIPSSSMERTLHCAKPGAFCEGRFSDRVIANRLAYRFGDPERGQIVVFKAPGRAQRCGSGDGGSTFVKRIVGLPGELVSERDGTIHINGERLIEPYVDPTLRGHETGSWPRLAPGHYFVLGDNRSHSCDSRTWGTVPRSSLIGPVMLSYWPPSRISFH
jgi:signal peptidase I